MNAALPHLPVSERFERLSAALPAMPGWMRNSWIDEIEVADEKWLVDRLVPAKAYMGLFGRRGSAKSFLALDLAYRLALGLPFLGRRTRRSGVLYCVGEKASPVNKRVAAWKLVNCEPAIGAPLDVRWGVPDLLDPYMMDAFAENLLAAKADFETRGAPLGLVVIDTLARALPTAHASDFDAANRAITAIQTLVERTGVTVMPVAHVAKAQGSDSQKGPGEWEDAAEALLRVERKEGSDVRLVTNTKQSDEKDGDVWAFELAVVQVEVSSDGEPIRSCAVVEVDPGDDALNPNKRLKPAKAPPLTVPAEIVRAALTRMIDDGRAEIVPPFPGVRPGTKGARFDPLREAAYALDLHRACEPPPGAEAKIVKAWVDSRRKAFQRGVDFLMSRGLTRQEGGWVWLL